MKTELLVWTGIAILLLTGLNHRIQFERSLQLLDERAKFWWLDGFSPWRIAGIAVPVAMTILGLVAAWILPDARLWIVVGGTCCLLVFALLFQYLMARRFSSLKFDPRFVRRMLWLMVATETGLLAGLSFIAFSLMSWPP